MAIHLPVFALSAVNAMSAPAGDAARAWLGWLGGTSAEAVLIALLVLVVRFVFARWLTPAWRYRLWWLVALRLLMPVLPASPTSIFNFDARHFPERWSATTPKPASTVQRAFAVDDSPGDPRVQVIIEPMTVARTAPSAEMTSAVSMAGKSVGTPRWPFVLMLFWLLGAATLLVRLVWGERRFAALLRDAAPVEDSRVLALLERCRREMRLSAAPAVLLTEAVASPGVTGIWRSKVLLPPGLIERLTDDELRLVLLHELSHVKYRDVAGNWALGLIQIVHWFNPAVWFAFARCRADREIARDAVVLQIDDTSQADTYGQTLLKLLDMTGDHRVRRMATLAGLIGLGSLGAIGMLRNGDQLKDRVRMISRRRRGAAYSTVGMLLMLTIGCATLTGPTSKKPSTAPITSTQPATSQHPELRSDTATLVWRDPPPGGLMSNSLEAPDVVLDRHVTGIHLGSRLGDAIDEFREKTGLKIVIDWQAIQAGGLGANTRVTINLFEVKAAKALQVLLDTASTAKCRLAYRTEKGAVYISTEQMFASTAADPAAPVNVAMKAILDSKLRDVKFDGVGFGDVVDFLRESSGADIFVNWKALEDGGIARNSPVTVKLHDVRFAKALQLILDCISTENCRVGYTTDEGVITVSTGLDLSKNTLTRVYHIGDLLVDASDFTAPPDLRHGDIEPPEKPATQPTQAASEQAREKIVAEVIRLIFETVAPESWKEKGGMVGSLKELSGELVVTQTPENHRELLALLEQLREQRGIQIVVNANFVNVLETTFAGLGESFSRLLLRDGESSRAKPLYLDDSELNRFMKAVRDDPASEMIASPRITLRNGQRASVVAASPRTYTADYTAIQGADNSIRYEPKTLTVESGAMMEVQPTVSPDRRSITLALHSQLSKLIALNEQPWPGRPTNSNLNIQVPEMGFTRLKTMVSLPEGQTLILFASNAPKLPDPPAGADAKTRPAITTQPHAKAHVQLFLVRATLVTDAKLERKHFPLLNTRIDQTQTAQ